MFTVEYYFQRKSKKETLSIFEFQFLYFLPLKCLKCPKFLISKLNSEVHSLVSKCPLLKFSIAHVQKLSLECMALV